MAERALPTNRRTNCKMFLVPILFLWPHHTTALRKMIAPLPTANASVCLVQFPWRSFNSPLLPRSGLVQSKFTTLGNPETYLWPKFARAFAPVTTNPVNILIVFIKFIWTRTRPVVPHLLGARPPCRVEGHADRKPSRSVVGRYDA